jgi:hypothetical protein
MTVSAVNYLVTRIWFCDVRTDALRSVLQLLVTADVVPAL